MHQIIQHRTIFLGIAITIAFFIFPNMFNPITQALSPCPHDPDLLCDFATVTAYADDDPFGLNAGAPATIQRDLDTSVGDLIKSILGIVGTIFLALMIWGGVRWMTSGGNEEAINSAKKTITQATLGLVVILFAYAITYFVIESIIYDA